MVIQMINTSNNTLEEVMKTYKYMEKSKTQNGTNAKITKKQVEKRVK